MALFYLPKAVPLTSSGSLMAGAQLFFYRTTTTTPQNVYTDLALTSPHNNPVVADANGSFPPIYLDTTAAFNYRSVLKTSGDVTQWTIDDIPASPTDALVPTLAASNVFTGASNRFQGAEVRLTFFETDTGSNQGFWDIDINGAVWAWRTRTDADGAGKNIIVASRGTTTTLASVVYGNATDLPTHSFYGATSATDAAGTLQALGWLDAPQNLQDANYGFVLSDRGKSVVHTSGSTHTWTIPANASVAFPVGTTIALSNGPTGGNVTIAITTDTLRLAGAGTTGSRTFAAHGVATLYKHAATVWYISGSAVT